MLQRFIYTKAAVAPMYKKNIGLALLDTTFRMPSTMLPSDHRQGQNTTRVAQLCLFIAQHNGKTSLFDNIRAYLEDLSMAELKYFLEEKLPNLVRIPCEALGRSAYSLTMQQDSNQAQLLFLRVLEFKCRYFLNTCPQTLAHSPPSPNQSQHALYRCKLCASVTEASCRSCLEVLVKDATRVYIDLGVESELTRADGQSVGDESVDLVLVMSMCLLKLAGICQNPKEVRSLRMLTVDRGRLLQAVLLLDFQLTKTPNNVPLRLMLVQVYLLLGCASLANQVWVPMDVKRIIQDALSPIFFDRISSISPGIFQGSKPLTEHLRSFYSSALQSQAPINIWEAFLGGSYTSVLEMAKFTDHLSRSCTRVMTVVEERRAARASNSKLEDMNDIPVFRKLTNL